MKAVALLGAVVAFYVMLAAIDLFLRADVSFGGSAQIITCYFLRGVFAPELSRYGCEQQWPVAIRFVAIAGRLLASASAVVFVWHLWRKGRLGLDWKGILWFGVVLFLFSHAVSYADHMPHDGPVLLGWPVTYFVWPGLNGWQAPGLSESIRITNPEMSLGWFVIDLVAIAAMAVVVSVCLRFPSWSRTQRQRSD